MYIYRVCLARKASTGCRGACVGLVMPRGRGPGESDLRRACVICRVLYFQVVDLDFLGEGREDLTCRSCRGGAGQGSRVGGRDWAWWSGKTLELIDFDVAL